MKLKHWTFDLRLTHRWSIASLPGDGSQVQTVVLVELTDADGVTGLGEASPSRTYAETPAGVSAFCERVDARRLSFDDVAGSQAYLAGLVPGEMAAKCAFNLALLDGAARRAGKPLYDFLGLGFQEARHVTSFSIGIDTPDVIRAKVLAAAPYPILKLKVGDAREAANLAAFREAAPAKPVRVDANEGWATREQALERLEWLARDGHIQFVEQPMPRDTPARDLIWLKERSPLPLLADESYRTVRRPRPLRRMFSRRERQARQDRRGGRGVRRLAGRPARGVENHAGLHDREQRAHHRRRPPGRTGGLPGSGRQPAHHQ